jgi:hypothetical protein
MAAGRSRDQAVFACLSCVVMLSLQRRAGQTVEGESRLKMLRLVAAAVGGALSASEGNYVGNVFRTCAIF